MTTGPIVDSFIKESTVQYCAGAVGCLCEVSGARKDGGCVHRVIDVM